MSDIRTDLKSLSREELQIFLKRFNLPAYRTGQLLHWIYSKYAKSIDDITEFSKDLRNRLKEEAYISNLSLLDRLKSKDGTQKFLFGLSDGNTIESVLIPDQDRFTLCISSQVGCAMGCVFCLTGKKGFIRNLKSHEIVDQIIMVNRLISPQKVTNIVLMGMGEPLANFDNVVEALWRMTEFIGISKRRITLSTSGLVPQMLLLPERAPGVNIALSLNATTDEVRNQIMPINRRYPINTLIDTCKKYPLQPRRRITFEYVMIDGVNDKDEDAWRLTMLLRGIRCKVNLIPLNPHPGCDMKRPSDETVLAFQNILIERGYTALIRESRGQDILAACGQLRGDYEGKNKKD